MTDLVLARTPAHPTRPAEAMANPQRDIRIGLVVAVLFFVVFLGWAALAQLDAAAAGQGTLVVSGQRQAVQHRDGGVVGLIAVKEGQKVEKGQLLVRIAAPEVQAQERALVSQTIRLLALRSRLEAEQAGGGALRVPAEFAQFAPEDQAEALRVLALQRREMSARAATLAAQTGALRQRGGQAGAQGRGFGVQASSADEQIRLINDQIEQLRPLAEKGFVSQTRMRELERMRAAMEGSRGQYQAETARSHGAARESELQGIEARQSFRERVASELRVTETELGDVLPKLAAAREQLARTEVRAPASGAVVGLSVFTPGGVVQPGQKLMDVVPDQQPLVISAQFQPQDADDLAVGQQVEVRFSGIQQHLAVTLLGKLTRVSADSLLDERSGQSYFTAEVVVPRQQLARLPGVLEGTQQLRPGMPADVLVPLRKRTALQYFIEPLTRQFWSALHEE